MKSKRSKRKPMKGSNASYSKKTRPDRYAGAVNPAHYGSNMSPGTVPGRNRSAGMQPNNAAAFQNYGIWGMPQSGSQHSYGTNAARSQGAGSQQNSLSRGHRSHGTQSYMPTTGNRSTGAGGSLPPHWYVADSIGED